MEHSMSAAEGKKDAAPEAECLDNAVSERVFREQCATALVAACLIAFYRAVKSKMYNFKYSTNTVKLLGVALRGLPMDNEEKVTVALSIAKNGEPWRTLILRAKLSAFHPAPEDPSEVFACADTVLRSLLSNFDECAAASPSWCGGVRDVNPKLLALDLPSTAAQLRDQIEPLLCWLSELFCNSKKTQPGWEAEFCTIQGHMPASLNLIASRYHLIWQKSRRELHNRNVVFDYPLGAPIPLIPFAKFPQRKQIHRYEEKDYWESDRDMRLRLIWTGLHVNAKESVVAPSNIVSGGTSESESESNKSQTISQDAYVSGYSPVLRTLLIGHLGSKSPLSKLPTSLIRRIYLEYKGLIHRLLNPCPGVFASIVGKVVKWPKYTGLNINMMPIRIGDLSSLPDSCRQYGAILASLPLSRDDYTVRAHPDYREMAVIGFLTIHESVIEADGESQRRGGVHTETPGRIWLNAEDGTLASSVKGKFDFMAQSPLTVAWGAGRYSETFKAHYEYNGGLYMGSNVAGSTKVWGNAQIKCPEETVGPLGDLEYLRHYLGEGSILDAGDIVWMTDTTPHESLPLPAGTRRQYFRLVTNHVNVWYEDHSTKNPLGVVPNPKLTTIVKGNKFENLN